MIFVLTTLPCFSSKTSNFFCQNNFIINYSYARMLYYAKLKKYVTNLFYVLQSREKVTELIDKNSQLNTDKDSFKSQFEKVVI